MHTRLTIRSLFFLILWIAAPVALSAQGGMADPEQPPLLKEGMQLSFYFFPANEAFSEEGAPLTADPVYLLAGERGVNEDREAVLWVSPDTNVHAPQPNAETRYDQDLSADYVILEEGQPITRNWMTPGAILGVHHIALKPGTDKAAFEKFIHDIWSPTRSDALPDSKLIFLKGLRGDRAGEYSYVWFIDSEETRDYYFPQSEVPSQMYADFEKGWSWLNDDNNLGKYLAAPEDDAFTDYVVIH